MPVTYRIDIDRKLILTVGDGVLTDSDVLGLKRRLHADPLFDPSFRELTDLSGVTELQVSKAGVAAFSGFDREEGDSHRLALVASEAVVFGMARMYQMVSPDGLERIGVYRTLEEARRFLGLEEAE